MLEISKTKETGTFLYFFSKRSAKDKRETERAQKDVDNHKKNVESKVEDVTANQKVLDSKEAAEKILKKEKAEKAALLKFALQQEIKECVRACNAARDAVAETFADFKNAKLSAQVGLQAGYASVLVANPKRKLTKSREL